MFQTAGLKRTIQVSDEAKNKADRIFSLPDEDNDNSNDSNHNTDNMNKNQKTIHDHKNSSTSNTESAFTGMFQTAGLKKTIQVSDEAKIKLIEYSVYLMKIMTIVIIVIIILIIRIKIKRQYMTIKIVALAILKVHLQECFRKPGQIKPFMYPMRR